MIQHNLRADGGIVYRAYCAMANVALEAVNPQLERRDSSIWLREVEEYMNNVLLPDGVTLTYAYDGDGVIVDLYVDLEKSCFSAASEAELMVVYLKWADGQ